MIKILPIIYLCCDNYSFSAQNPVFFFCEVVFSSQYNFFCLVTRTGCFLLLGVEILPSVRRLLSDKFFLSVDGEARGRLMQRWLWL